MKIFVNPLVGITNDPDLIAFDVIREQSGQYTKTDDCFWYQNPETGYTSFLYHGRAMNEVSPGIWTMPNAGGFGGRCFTISVKDYGIVHVNGPWSGGCYCANDCIPKPAVEIIHDRVEVSCTIEKVNEAMVDKDWEVVLISRYYHSKWPVAVWKGIHKEKMTPQVLQLLKEKYEGLHSEERQRNARSLGHASGSITPGIQGPATLGLPFLELP